MTGAWIQNQVRPRKGMMLVDCLIYLAISSLLIGLGIALFLRCLGAATELSHNADDIAGALTLGEQWRADLRRANAEPHPTRPGAADLIIPGAKGTIAYRLLNGAIWRQESGDAAWTRLLDRVVRVEWTPEDRSRVIAWHMDIEMKTKKRHIHVRPLFSFVGVAGDGRKP